MSAPEQLAPGEFRLHSHVEGETHFITLEGELDLANTAQLSVELEAAERSDVEQIVVDLAELTFIDSTGVALLVDAIKRSQQNANRLRIRRSGSIGVRRILETTGIEDRLPYVD